MTDPWETDESKIYESIFGPNGRWQHDGPSIATGWYGCATAYKTSADLLVDGLSACPVNNPDLARPIMFLYRHYLELVLKGVLGTLQACQFYLAEPTGKPRVNPKPEHSLMEIWEQIQAAISELESGIPDYLTESVHTITERIRELEEVDAPSTRFRYPVDIQGNPTLKRLPSKSELLHVKGVIAAMSKHMDGMAFGAEERFEGLWQMYESER